jgi:hypothetical protein
LKTQSKSVSVHLKTLLSVAITIQVSPVKCEGSLSGINLTILTLAQTASLQIDHLSLLFFIKLVRRLSSAFNSPEYVTTWVSSGGRRAEKNRLQEERECARRIC